MIKVCHYLHLYMLYVWAHNVVLNWHVCKGTNVCHYLYLYVLYVWTYNVVLNWQCMQRYKRFIHHKILPLQTNDFCKQCITFPTTIMQNAHISKLDFLTERFCLLRGNMSTNYWRQQTFNGQSIWSFIVTVKNILHTIMEIIGRIGNSENIVVLNSK